MATMKKLFLISGFIMIISCKKENQQKTVGNSIPEDSLNIHSNVDSLRSKNNLSSIDGIKKEYDLVNSKLTAKTFDSASFKFECDERSGDVVYYSEKGILKAIKYFTADSHFSSVEKYFISVISLILYSKMRQSGVLMVVHQKNRKQKMMLHSSVFIFQTTKSSSV